MDKLLEQRETIDLGDKRLSDRYVQILEECSKRPSSSILGTFKSWAAIKGAYRFFDNKKVTSEKLLEHHYKTTRGRIKAVEGERDVLLIQDTSSLNYSNHRAKKELGKTSSYIDHGLLLHPTIAITPSRINLGLVEAEMWTRNTENETKDKHTLAMRPIEMKESSRWLRSFQIAEEVAQQCPEKQIFNIADREGDIYELFLKAQASTEKNAFFIIRSAQNRLVSLPERKLKETMKKAPIVGKITFQQKGKGEKNRLVTQIIRSKSIEFKSPIKKPGLDRVNIHVVLSQELNPPKGEKPIEWTILTNFPLKTLKDVQKILSYYTARWEIETYFKVLKSGCKIEEVGLAKLHRLKNCLATYMVVAWQVMFLLKLGREYPDLPCELIFSPLEWKTAYMAIHRIEPPKKPPKLGEIVICIACLGGYLNRKSDPPPGPKVMWIGIQQLYPIILGVQLGRFFTE